MEPIGAGRVEGIGESAGGADGAGGQRGRGAVEVEGMDGSVGGIPCEGIAGVDRDRRNSGGGSCRRVPVLDSGWINDPDGNGGSLGEGHRGPNQKSERKIFPCQRHSSSSWINSKKAYHLFFGRVVRPQRKFQKSFYRLNRVIRRTKTARNEYKRKGQKVSRLEKEVGNGFTQLQRKRKAPARRLSPPLKKGQWF